MLEVRTPEGLLAGEVSGGVGAASGVVADPWRIRRELTSPAGSVLETVLAPERLPGFLVQWGGPGAGAVRPSLVLPGVEPDRLTGGGGSIVEARGPGDGVRLIRLVGGVLGVREGEGGVRLEGSRAGRDGADDPSLATLVAAWGEDAGRARSRLATLSRTAVVEGWGRGAAEASGGLRLLSGVPELDAALTWARARLRARPAFEGAPGLPPPRPVLPSHLEEALAVLALLVVGDEAGATSLAAATDPATTPGVLARSWITAWRGTTGAVEADRDALLAWAARTPASDDPLEPVARTALADALEVAGWEEDAAAVRSAWRPSGPPAPSEAGSGAPDVGGPGTGRRLPVVGGAPSPDRATVEHVVASALRVPTAPRPVTGQTTAGAPTESGSDLLRGWVLCAAGRGEEGYPPLRAATRPSRETGSGAYLSGEAATLLPLALVLGLLGARADAGYGRIRLAPTLPAAWTRFRTDGLAVGDARLDLLYRREAEVRTFTLRPSGGGIPATVVLEAVVPGGVRAVVVDGRAASVETETVGGRTRVRLQLPVDAERSVRVTGTGAPGR